MIPKMLPLKAEFWTVSPVKCCQVIFDCRGLPHSKGSKILGSNDQRYRNTFSSAPSDIFIRLSDKSWCVCCGGRGRIISSACISHQLLARVQPLHGEKPPQELTGTGTLLPTIVSSYDCHMSFCSGNGCTRG